MAALLLVVGPASARADWLFTPNIGDGFGGDTPEQRQADLRRVDWLDGRRRHSGARPTWRTRRQFFENNTDNISFADRDNVTTADGAT